MKVRAASFPNYRWPAAWLGRAAAPWRWLAAAVFYSSWLAGRIASIINLRRAVAIIRTDGAGDAILFEPALQSIARQYDGHAIHLWAPPHVCDLFESHQFIHRFIRVPRGYKAGNFTVFWSLPWRAKLGWQLGRNSYDVAIYPPEDPEPLGSWLLAKMRAHEKWLNAGSTLNQFDWQQRWSHQFATELLEKREGGGHELARNAHLASQWGSAIENERPDLPLSPRALTYASVHVGAARHAVRRARAAGLIGVIPCGSAAVNQYPIEKWAEALSILWEQHALLPALLGGPDDAVILDKIAALVGDSPLHRFPVNQDIAVAAAVVSRLDGVVSVDTGLAHAAVSFDLPTVVLVTGGMPERFWPWTIPTRSIVMTKPMPCAGCNYVCTQSSSLCITDVSPQWMVDALIRAMQSKKILPQVEKREYRHAG